MPKRTHKPRKKFLVNRAGDLSVRHTPATVADTRRTSKSNTKRNLAIAGGVALSIGAFGVAATAYDRHKKRQANERHENASAKNYDRVMEIVNKGGGMQWKKRDTTVWYDALSDLSVTPHGESKMWHDN